MISLDFQTLLIVNGVAMAVLGGVLLMTWLSDRRIDALLWLAGAPMLGLAALAGIALRGTISDFLSIDIANAMAIFAFGMAWVGFRRLDDRPVPWLTLAAGPVIWLALVRLPFFVGSIDSRIVLNSVLTAAYIAAAAWTVWERRHDGVVARWMVFGILVTHGLVSLLRPVIVTLIPTAADNQTVAQPRLAWFNLEFLVFFMFLTFAVAVMVRERSERRYKRDSERDPLTGLMNRRAFLDIADRWCRRQGGDAGLSVVLLLDLDHFKLVNERYGHAGGDHLLQIFAATVQESIRRDDLVGRLGGEEFVVLLPMIDSRDGAAIAERIRKAFCEAATRNGFDATVSIGLAQTHGFFVAEHGLGPVIATADRGLYQAKAHGRNRVERAGEAQLTLPGMAEPEVAAGASKTVPLRRREAKG